MSRSTTLLTEPLREYLLGVSLREPEVLRRLRAETASLPNANMQIAPEQGQFMAFLVEMLGARQTLEVGVFTGYSSLSVALALPARGRVVACDLNEEWTAIARRYWEEAGVREKIDLRIAPALETLRDLREELDAGLREPFDFAFVDADKANYEGYLDLMLGLLRPGGVVAFDNTLWNGKVADASVSDDDTEAIRHFNLALKDDERVTISLVPIGDGLTLARKRYMPPRVSP